MKAKVNYSDSHKCLDRLMWAQNDSHLREGQTGK